MEERNNNYYTQNANLKETVDAFERLDNINRKDFNQKIKAKEEASKAEIERFSNEKGKEQNQIYEDYTNDSIKELFIKKTLLVEEKLALMEEITAKKIEMQQMKLNAELDIKKQYAEAEIEKQQMLNNYDLKIKQKKEEYEKMHNEKRMNIFTKIFFPFLGVVIGALTFFLLYIYK